MVVRRGAGADHVLTNKPFHSLIIFPHFILGMQCWTPPHAPYVRKWIDAEFSTRDFSKRRNHQFRIYILARMHIVRYVRTYTQQTGLCPQGETHDFLTPTLSYTNITPHDLNGPL